jgi:KaiC/GvpD/RAD55 family RecA-like ATPase
VTSVAEPQPGADRPTAAAARLAVAIYADHKANRPKIGGATWLEIADELTTHRRTECTLATCAKKECPHKYGQAWSPVAIEGSRSNANVRAVTMLVYDLDHVPAEDTSWMKRLRAERVAHVVHSSHSHRDDDVCLRLVILPSRDVAPAEYPRLWLAVIDRYGLPADRACKDLSRIYFLPSCPTDAAPIAASYEGEPLDVDAVLAAAPQAPTTARMQPDPARGVDDGAPIAEGGRNTGLVKLAGQLRHSGMSCEAIEAALLVTNAERCKPPLPDNEVVSIARSVSRYEPGRDVAGDAAFAQHLRELSGSLPAGAIKLGDHSSLLDDYGADSRRRNHVIGALIARGHDPASLLQKSGDELLAMYNEANAAAMPPLASDIAGVQRPPVRTYTTGLPKLDMLIGGGIKTRSMTGIVARTAAGKTGLVIKVGHHVTRAYGVPFLYVSSELDQYEVADREAAQELDVPHNDLSDGRIPQDRARAALDGMRVHVIGSEVMDDAHGGRALEVIERAVQAVAEKHGEKPVLAVDFLQELASDDDDRDQVRTGVTRFARRLRALARRLDIAVIAVSSTARQFYKPPKDGADDPLSYLGAAKESGDIEFALANMLFLDVATEHEGGVYPARIVVAKARRGTAGFVGARFHGPSGRWEQDDASLESMTAEARKDPRKELKDRDDSKVLAAVLAAAGRNEYRTPRQWRGLIPGISEKRTEDSIKRLVAAQRLALTEFHPDLGLRARGGGQYVTPPKRAPEPPYSNPALKPFFDGIKLNPEVS